eukprot:768628-Hanusia_phi.AAC.13
MSTPPPDDQRDKVSRLAVITPPSREAFGNAARNVHTDLGNTACRPILERERKATMAGRSERAERTWSERIAWMP